MAGLFLASGVCFVNRSTYIASLVHLFLGQFMQALKDRDPSTLSDLAHCRCTVADTDSTHPEIEFDMPGLLDALWRQGIIRGLQLPESDDWGKDFKEFCQLLGQPKTWPALAHHGYTIRPRHISSRIPHFRYRLSTI
jgi:hypothetical protein